MDSECPHCKRVSDVEDFTVEYVSTDESEGPTVAYASCPDCGESFSATELGLVSPIVGDSSQPSTDSDGHFGHFRLLRILGRGGFGTVWLADDLKLERQVALKLPVETRRDVNNLLREARTAAKLRHPNIVSIHQVGELDGQPYIVCDYIEGMDLRSYLSKGLPSQSQVIDLLRQIAAGLHHAHEQSIVHRDMKPGNVLLDSQGNPLITDFGLAKRVDVDESISSRGKIIGTVMYMAPEQAHGEIGGVDRRADLYALGVMMYQMLTGERPYRGNVQAILHDKINEDPTPLRRLRPSIPRDLETICLKCLQRSPTRRYDTAQEFIEELDRFVRGEPIQARPVTTWEYAWRWCVRNPLVSGLTVLLLSSLIIGLVSTTTFWLKAEEQTAKLQRSLYASQMAMAGDYLFVGDLDTAHRCLDQFATDQLEHLRGFEWFYLNSVLKRYGQTVQHGRLIEDVAISREADWFVSISDDRELCVWDASSGKRLRSIPAHSGRWQSVAVSFRNNQVAAGSKDGSLYVWDAIHDPDDQPRVIRHGPGVTKLMYSRDGKLLFTAGESGAVRVWKSDSLELSSEIPTGREGVVCFAASDDGNILVVVGTGGTIRAWEVDTKSKLCTLEEDRRVESVLVAHDGARFWTGGYSGTLSLFDTFKGLKLSERDTDYNWITAIEYMGSSDVAALCTSMGTTALIDTQSNQELRIIKTHHSAGGRLALSNNGRFLVVGSKMGTMRVIDTSDFRRPTVLSSDQAVRHVCWLGDGVCVASYQDGAVKRLDFNSGEIQPWHAGGRPLPTMDSCPQASLLAICHTVGQLELVDAFGKSLAILQRPAEKNVQMRFSADGQLFALGEGGRQVTLFRVNQLAQSVIEETFTLPPIETEAAIRDLSFSPDNRLAVSWSDGVIRFADLTTKRWLPNELSFPSMPLSIGFSDDCFLVGLRDGHLVCMSADAAEELWRVKAQVGHLNRIAVIPGSRAVATVGQQSDLQLWDFERGDLRVRLNRHSQQVFALDVSPRGDVIVTGGLDGRVQIWTGKTDSI